VVSGLNPGQVGDLAYENSVRLHELAPVHASLEQAFMELTASSVQFRAGVPSGATGNGRHGDEPDATDRAVEQVLAGEVL